MPLDTASSSAGSRSASATGRSTSSSNSEPAVAASSSRSAVAGRRRASRRATTSRTLSGGASSSSGRVSRTPPPEISTASPSTRLRHSSQTRNGLPSVMSAIALGSSGTARSPATRRTNSATSSPDRPPRRSRTTSSERRRSASSSDSASGMSVSVSRKVATSSSRARPPARARCRSRPSVGASAQCASSSTSTTGRSRPARSSRSATAVCRRWRSVSGSVAAPVPAAQLAERLHERAVGRMDDGVARAVEDERAALGRLAANSRTSRLLPDPASPPTQRDPPALALRPRDERSQRDQLALAPHEREPRLRLSGPGSVLIVRSDHRRRLEATRRPPERRSGRVMTRPAARS